MKKAVKQFYKNTKPAKPPKDRTKLILLAALITGIAISLYTNFTNEQKYECIDDMCLIK